MNIINRKIIVLSLIFAHISSYAIDIQLNDTTASNIDIDYLNRLYVKCAKKIVRYKLNGDLDKEYRLKENDSLIRSFLMPNREILLVTKNSKKIYVLNEEFQLSDSVDTKKIAGFDPIQLLSIRNDEFAVINSSGDKISTYDYNFGWKADINYNISNLGDKWIFVNGFGGGYRYFYSKQSNGILRTDNNGTTHGFIPIGSEINDFYVFIKDQKEKAFIYAGGSFVEASFDNINDMRVKASIPRDREINALLINEVAIKLYRDKISILNVKPNF